MRNLINKNTDKEDVIEKVMDFVIKTNTDLETKIHATKSILYKSYNINVDHSVIKKRFNDLYR